MDEDKFNLSVRKFLKEVGVTSQRVIENARAGCGEVRATGGERVASGENDTRDRRYRHPASRRGRDRARLMPEHRSQNGVATICRSEGRGAATNPQADPSYPSAEDRGSATLAG